MNAPAPNPLSESLEDLQSHLLARLGEDAPLTLARDEFTLTTEPARLKDLMQTLRDDPAASFTLLMDVCAVDYPERPKRFELVYHLLSITRNWRLRVKLPLAEGEAAPSLTELFPAAGWYEREAFDMYGIAFSGHPDLRRILTDYGFSGHPLRKDFPLTGFVELAYDEAHGVPVYRPVQLQQEFRRFDFLSPWEGMDKPAARLPHASPSQKDEDA